MSDINARIDKLEAEIGNRFDELAARIDKRFDELEAGLSFQFKWMVWMQGIVVTLVVGLFLMMIRLLSQGQL